MAKKNSHKNWTTREVAQLIRLRQQRWTLVKIAEVTGRPYWSVVWKLSQMGVTLEERSAIQTPVQEISQPSWRLCDVPRGPNDIGNT